MKTNVEIKSVNKICDTSGYEIGSYFVNEDNELLQLVMVDAKIYVLINVSTGNRCSSPEKIHADNAYMLSHKQVQALTMFQIKYVPKIEIRF